MKEFTITEFESRIVELTDHVIETGRPIYIRYKDRLLELRVVPDTAPQYSEPTPRSP